MTAKTYIPLCVAQVPPTTTVTQKLKDWLCTLQNFQFVVNTGRVITVKMDGWQETKESIAERIGFLCNNQALSDVTILVGPDSVPFVGHKIILAAASPFFEKLFFGSMAVNNNNGGGTVIFPAMDPTIFERLLQYIYRDEFIPGEEEEDDWLMLETAKMCLMPHLVQKCVTRLVQQLKSVNVLEFLQKAIAIDERELAEAALRFFDWDASSIIWTEQFVNIDRDLLCTLLQRKTLCVIESDLYDAVLRWSEAECQRRGQEPTKLNQRLALGPALELIRFPTMNAKQFSFRADTGILSLDEVTMIQQRDLLSPFPTHRRQFAPDKYKIRRFLSYGFTDDVPLDQLTDDGGTFLMSFKLESDRIIFLHSLSAYGAFQDPPVAAVTTEIRIDIYQDEGNNNGRLLATSVGHSVSTYPCPPDSVKVKFDENGPLILYPGVQYRISAMGTISVYQLRTRASSSVLIRSSYGIGPIQKIKFGPPGHQATLSITGPSIPEYPPTIRDKYIVGQIPEIILSI